MIIPLNGTILLGPVRLHIREVLLYHTTLGKRFSNDILLHWLLAKQCGFDVKLSQM